MNKKRIIEIVETVGNIALYYLVSLLGVATIGAFFFMCYLIGQEL